MSLTIKTNLRPFSVYATEANKEHTCILSKNITSEQSSEKGVSLEIMADGEEWRKIKCCADQT